jgi:hypothetical protein
MLNLLCILLIFTSSIKCSGETAAEFAKRTFRHKHEGYWKTPYTDFSKMWQEWREQQEPIVPTAEPTLYEPEIELERQPTLDDVQYDIEYVDVEQIIEARKQTEAAFLAKGEPLAKTTVYNIDEQIQNFEKMSQDLELYIKQLKKYLENKTIVIEQVVNLLKKNIQTILNLFSINQELINECKNRLDLTRDLVKTSKADLDSLADSAMDPFYESLFQRKKEELDKNLNEEKEINLLHKKVSVDQIKQLIETFLKIKGIFIKINKLEPLKKEEYLEYADQIKKYQEIFKSSLGINRFVGIQIEKSQDELKKEIAFWEKKISDQKDAIKKLTKQKQTTKLAAAKKNLATYQARVKEKNALLKKLAAMASDYRSAISVE